LGTGGQKEQTRGSSFHTADSVPSHSRYVIRMVATGGGDILRKEYSPYTRKQVSHQVLKQYLARGNSASEKRLNL